MNLLSHRLAHQRPFSARSRPRGRSGQLRPTAIGNPSEAHRVTQELEEQKTALGFRKIAAEFREVASLFVKNGPSGAIPNKGVRLALRGSLRNGVETRMHSGADQLLPQLFNVHLVLGAIQAWLGAFVSAVSSTASNSARLQR